MESKPPNGRNALARWCRQHFLAATLLASAALLLLVSAAGGLTLGLIAAREASQARSDRDEAREAARRAEQQAIRAELEKQDAQSARFQAEQEAQRIELEAHGKDWLQYAHLLADARHAWAAGNLSQARSDLHQCRWDFQGWEYGFLRAAANGAPGSDGAKPSQRGRTPAIRSFLAHPGGIYSLASNREGTRLATSGADQTVRLWDISGRELNTLKGHKAVVWSVAFSPDGKRIATGSADKTVKLWDASSGALLRTFDGHADAVAAVAFSPTGADLASGGADHLIRVWEIESGEEIRKFRGHANLVSSLAFSPDGKRIASGSADQTIKLWDLDLGKGIRTYRADPDGVSAVTFSPDGKRIASGGNDGLIKVWDAFSERNILTTPGHSGGVWAVRFLPGGKRIASGGLDQTLKIWQAASGLELLTLPFQNEVRSLAVSSDGNRISAGCWDGKVFVLDASAAPDHPVVGEALLMDFRGSLQKTSARNWLAVLSLAITLGGCARGKDAGKSAAGKAQPIVPEAVAASNSKEPNPVRWQRINLDKTFRSEGVAAFDVNRDGKVDVVAGDVWYEAPGWKMHEIRTPGKYVANDGYSDSFLNFGFDINGDGWVDLICIGFPGADVAWYENPKNAAEHWKKHLIWHSACNETPNFSDLLGSGKPQLIFGSQPENQMGDLAVPRRVTSMRSGPSTPSVRRARKGCRDLITERTAITTALASAISTRTAATT